MLFLYLLQQKLDLQRARSYPLSRKSPTALWKLGSQNRGLNNCVDRYLFVDSLRARHVSTSASAYVFCPSLTLCSLFPFQPTITLVN